MNDIRYHRSQATISTLRKVFYTPGGPERFFEFCLLSSSLLLWRFTLGLGGGVSGRFSMFEIEYLVTTACLF